jgi:hypothetical protein
MGRVQHAASRLLQPPTTTTGLALPVADGQGGSTPSARPPGMLPHPAHGPAHAVLRSPDGISPHEKACRQKARRVPSYSHRMAAERKSKRRHTAAWMATGAGRWEPGVPGGPSKPRHAPGLASSDATAAPQTRAAGG